MADEPDSPGGEHLSLPRTAHTPPQWPEVASVANWGRGTAAGGPLQPVQWLIVGWRTSSLSTSPARLRSAPPGRPIHGTARKPPQWHEAASVANWAGMRNGGWRPSLAHVEVDC